jgi:hypothetical protein
MRNWQFSWFQQKGVLQDGANVAYDKKIHRRGNKIPSKYKEMIALQLQPLYSVHIVRYCIEARRECMAQRMRNWHK